MRLLAVLLSGSVPELDQARGLLKGLPKFSQADFDLAGVFPGGPFPSLGLFS